jgi:hypothetical protein
MATAAHAFTNASLHIVAQQRYSLGPGGDPLPRGAAS